MPYYVYFLTNYSKSVLYIGFTGNLEQRLYQHKALEVEGFTKKYKVTNLIYFEEFQNVEDAKARERAIKKWNRSWKEESIAQSNPQWEEMHIQ